tara:strand:+ start:191 stop:754 length:564 start_codon:yes stop_codon:yes gene_type:complete
MIKKIYKFFIFELSQLFLWIILSYPDSRIGLSIRKKYWKKKLKSCGNNIEIRRGSAIGFPSIIEIGNNFILGNFAHITAAGSKGIYIGNDVSISRGTYFHGSNHKFDNPNLPIMKQGTEASSLDYKNKTYSIVLCDDVWIGSNVVILSGTFLSKGCIVSSGSVVSGFYDEYSIIGGNPARFIKKRFK